MVHDITELKKYQETQCNFRIEFDSTVDILVTWSCNQENIIQQKHTLDVPIHDIPTSSNQPDWFHRKDQSFCSILFTDVYVWGLHFEILGTRYLHVKHVLKLKTRKPSDLELEDTCDGVCLTMSSRWWFEFRYWWPFWPFGSEYKLETLMQLSSAKTM